MSAKKPQRYCECGKEISRRAAQCRTCANRRTAVDPVACARRSASLQRVMSSPEVRAKVSRAVRRVAAARANDPTWIDGKRRGGQKAFAAGNLDAGRTPAARAKAGKAISAAHLSHIPEAYRDFYMSLKSRGLSAPQRERLVHERIAAEQAERRAAFAAMTPFERQMARVAAGARLINKPVLRRADPDFTLGGVSAGLL